MAKIETYPAILNSAISTSDQIIVNDASGPNTTKNMTFLEIDKRYVVTSGNSTVAGVINATAFVGDGSGLTGIASGTGGVINTGSTTIGADSDADGVGVIDFQTRGVSRGGFQNLGDFYINNNFGVGTASPSSEAITGTLINVEGAGNNGYVITDSADGQESHLMQTDGFYIDIGGHTTGTNNFLSVRTAPGNSSYGWVERLRVDSTGRIGCGVTPLTNMDSGDMVLEGGAIVLKERITPTADADYAKIYPKADNKLYFQDGAGTEHEIAFV